MSISGISSSSGLTPDASTFQNVRNRVQQDFNQISQSLQTSDLAGAQKAYADLVQLTPGGQNAAAGAAANPAQSDFASLGAALQSGDLSGAQTAFSKLQTDLSTATQGAPQAGHHHHHHHGAAPASSTSDATATDPTATASTATTTTAATTTASSILGNLVKTGLSLLG